MTTPTAALWEQEDWEVGRGGQGKADPQREAQGPRWGPGRGGALAWGVATAGGGRGLTSPGLQIAPRPRPSCSTCTTGWHQRRRMSGSGLCTAV